MILPLVEKAIKQFLTDQVNGRLTTALEAEESKADETLASDSEKNAELAEWDLGIVTTELEMEGFYIVKAIACSEVDASRVVMRDAKC